MNKFDTRKRTKVTVRIIKPILEAFNARTEEACIRRDALISKALEVELPRVRAEITIKNSPKARAYIQAKLKSMLAMSGGGSLLTLALSSDATDLLEQTCEEKNIPRDTLMNRLLLLLGAPGQYLETRMYPFVPVSWVESYDTEATPFDLHDLSAITKDKGMLAAYAVSHYAGELAKIQAQDGDFDKAFSPLGRVANIMSDPLQWYRIMLSIRKDEDRQAMEKMRAGSSTTPTLWEYQYTPFGKPFDDEDWDGLNCVMEDEWVKRLDGLGAKPNK